MILVLVGAGRNIRSVVALEIPSRPRDKQTRLWR